MFGKLYRLQGYINVVILIFFLNRLCLSQTKVSRARFENLIIKRSSCIYVTIFENRASCKTKLYTCKMNASFSNNILRTI